MKKSAVVTKVVLISLAAMLASGCTFIVKGEQATKYYGIDEERGSELLGQLEGKQQDAQAAETVSEAPVPGNLK